MGNPIKVKVYLDTRKEWRWQIVSTGNGKILADSAEGYKNHSDCMHALDLIRGWLASAAVEDPQALARLLASNTIIGQGSRLR